MNAKIKELLKEVVTSSKALGRTLDEIPFTGRENLDKALGCIQTSEDLANRAQRLLDEIEDEEAEKTETEAGEDV